MNHKDTETQSFVWRLFSVPLCLCGSIAGLFGAQPASLVPVVPEGFTVQLVAREPLVRNPCAMAFDARGRLFVGQGPQYRNPKPNTPGDSVEILVDTDGDGIFDKTKTFARGLNCVQGLAWRGRDLYIANSPDLTICRDLDGDDEADEYVLVYTDLGNIEHGLHGLHFAPDGKLYMSKGNSKGLNNDAARAAPKPFRELFDIPTPPGAPDFPGPRTFTKDTYRKTYHDPQDDWGRMGGTLRCDPDGSNLEIVSRGYRNPFDVAFDSAFNWLGTDNDQTEGDRIIMPFFGAHFGWAHGWSANWTGENHLPTAPISGPVFTGSGTGVVFLDTPGWPEAFRGVWLINDFLHRTTYLYRPRWEGALLMPDGGRWQPFARAGESLFQPIDIRVGPDGALYLTGWGAALALVSKDGQQANEGRVFRISPVNPTVANSNWNTPVRGTLIAKRTNAELITDLGASVAAWRTDATDELVRRGAAAKSDLIALLQRGRLTTAQETWALWTLGRLEPRNREIDAWFASVGPTLSTNARLQSLRIVAHRLREWQREATLPAFVSAALDDVDARIRFTAVQSIMQARQASLADALWSVAAKETERLTFYAAWRALQELVSTEALRAKLDDPRAGVRRAALLASLEKNTLSPADVEPLVKDSDAATGGVAALWLAKRGGNPLLVIEPPPGDFSGEIRVAITPGIKPSQVSYTTDGAEPTPATRRSTARFQIKDTTTVKAALFVDGRKVGNTAEVTYRRRAAANPAEAIVLTPPSEPTTVASVVALLPKANATRGHAVFSAAGCFVCHQVDQDGGSFGPDLSAMAARGNPENVVRSILEPNAAITEGYALLTVTTRDGKSVGGRLHEETGAVLTLMQPDGSRARIPRAEIAKRESLHVSPMPAFDRVLSPHDLADLVAWLTKTGEAAASLVTSATPGALNAKTGSTAANTNASTSRSSSAFAFETKDDRLIITDAGQPVAAYVFKDAETLRPHLQNLHAPSGAKITRNHPPVAGDPADHATMHPGAWFAFGSINGEDFWRNKARIEHERFVEAAAVKDGVVSFATSNRLLTPAGQLLATQLLRVSIARRGDAYLFTCETTLKSDDRDLVFSEQEEMGFGVRLATPLIEKKGGKVANSDGRSGAKQVWGKVADWCSYSGEIDGRVRGAAVFASPKNPQRSWWHTRDYGLMVANPFGKRVLPTGSDGTLTIKRGAALTLRFGLLIFDAPATPDFAAIHHAFIATP